MSERAYEEMGYDGLMDALRKADQDIERYAIERRKLLTETNRVKSEYDGLKKRASERMYAIARLLKLMDENTTTHGARHGQIEMLIWIARRWAQADGMDFQPEIDASDIPF